MKKYFRVITAFLSICLILTSCASTENGKQEYSQEVQNLEKLCLVWGYTKYRHPAFYTGEKDWDEELLTLIPQVQEAKTDKETNQILYDWFLSLGQTDFEETRNHQSWKNQDPEAIDIQADLSWIKDTEYIGKELSEVLQQIEVLPNISKPQNPPVAVSSTNSTLAVTFNEKANDNFDYSNVRDRLSGLFRMWNVLEYYSPYIKMTDENWHEILPQFIEEMLLGNDKHSYELTIAKLLAKLRDGHANLKDESYMLEEFGEYYVPVYLETVEGYPVVTSVYAENCPLMVGDAIIKMNGVAIEEEIEKRMEYVSTSTDEKRLSCGGVYDWLLSSQEPEIELTVLRNDVEKTMIVPAAKEHIGPFSRHYPAPDTVSYRILDGNIGLLNLELVKNNEIESIMEELSQTDGLIVDMRQYPFFQAAWMLQNHLSKEGAESAIWHTYPYEAYPGAYFFKNEMSGSSIKGHQGDYSQKPIVIIINEETASRAEYMAMIYKTNPNVVLLGEQSAGVDGERRAFDMPDGNMAAFTVTGIYGPNKEQVQRTGLTPDIEVHPTIEGIREGRDELMEAAVKYIKEQKNG